MATHNQLESIMPCSGHYSLKKDLLLSSWLFVAALVYIAAELLLKHHPAASPALRCTIALTPLLPSLLYARSWWKFVRSMDELQRRVQAEVFLCAALGALLVQVILTTLSDNGANLGSFNHGLGLGSTFFVMIVFWFTGTMIVNRRLK